MKKLNLILTISALLIISCKQNQSTKETVQGEVQKGDIVNTIINDIKIIPRFVPVNLMAIERKP